jgi:hypothetical protein
MPTTAQTAPPPDQTRLRTTLARIALAARAIADADPAQVEATARQLGESRRYLAPVAWGAGALVLLARGVKLLVLNWRLSLIELVPAVWVWLVLWDLKQGSLRHDSFREITLADMTLLGLVTIGASVAAFWCNTVFAFAITHPKPQIGLAVRQARRHLVPIVGAGVVLGVVVAVGLAAIPRIESRWLYLIASLGLYGLMLVVFVAVPARIIGARKQRLRPKEVVGRWTVGGAMSAVAMGPGLILDRVGLILLGVPHLHVLGFVLLSIGTALYAAGMSSVKAVKLSMKLETDRE